VATLYGVAAIFCITLPSDPPVPAADRPHVGGRAAVAEAGQAVGSTMAQLREGIGYIREHTAIAWTLVYLGIAAGLVGVIGVLGPSFAQQTLGLNPKDLIVVVLPLGLGIVMGILILNAYGRLVPRRRVIEGGLIALGILLALMATAGRISAFLNERVSNTNLPDLSLVTSLMSIVVAVAFFAGIAYAFVAIPSQTQLQEDLPEEVRGRVFGVLNMLVSVSSFLPILIVGPMADILAKVFPNEGTTIILVVVAALIVASGILSIYLRGPLRPTERTVRATVGDHGDPFVQALGAEVQPLGVTGTNVEFYGDDDENGTAPTHPVEAVTPAVAGVPAALTQVEPSDERKGAGQEGAGREAGPGGAASRPTD
jgi:Major Facilitator Superfamily